MDLVSSYLSMPANIKIFMAGESRKQELEVGNFQNLLPFSIKISKWLGRLSLKNDLNLLGKVNCAFWECGSKLLDVTGTQNRITFQQALGEGGSFATLGKSLKLIFQGSLTNLNIDGNWTINSVIMVFYRQEKDKVSFN